MKKFTNNALWGVISMVLNVVILCMVVFSAVLLGSYDKKNTHLNDDVMLKYSFWRDSVDYAETALSKKQTSLSGYENFLLEKKKEAEQVREKLEKNPDDDSLRNIYYSDTTHLAEFAENIIRLKEDVRLYEDTVNYAKAGFKPWEEKHKKAVDDASPVLRNYNIVILITAFLLLLKMFFFGFWMLRNTKNLRKVSKWWTRSSDALNVVSWFIPVYNLFKPCSLFSNLVSETSFILREKSILKSDDSNHMESMGFWWGSHLFAKIVMPLFVGGMSIAFNIWLCFFMGIYGGKGFAMDWSANELGFLKMGTIFGNSGAYFYIRPHAIIIILFVLAWAVYVGYECYVIFKYNKLNKMMCDNEDKFDFDDDTKHTVEKTQVK